MEINGQRSAVAVERRRSRGVVAAGRQTRRHRRACKSDWSTSFPLGSVAYDGRLPVKAVIDVSAAPGASDTAPVASLFLNDYLIGAQ